MTNLLTVGLRGLRGVDGGTIAPAARRATGGQARFVLLAVVTCVAVLALGAASAQALQLFSFQFGTSGSAGGELNSPQGVAVDQARATSMSPTRATSGSRNSADSPHGNFLLAFGQDVDATTAGTSARRPTRASTAGRPQAGHAGRRVQRPAVRRRRQFGGAVGRRRLCRVIDGDDTITKFDSSGNLVTSWATGGQLDGDQLVRLDRRDHGGQQRESAGHQRTATRCSAFTPGRHADHELLDRVSRNGRPRDGRGCVRKHLQGQWRQQHRGDHEHGWRHWPGDRGWHDGTGGRPQQRGSVPGHRHRRKPLRVQLVGRCRRVRAAALALSSPTARAPRPTRSGQVH